MLREQFVRIASSLSCHIFIFHFAMPHTNGTGRENSALTSTMLQFDLPKYATDRKTQINADTNIWGLATKLFQSV
jgi:hypothetical protein